MELQKPNKRQTNLLLIEQKFDKIKIFHKFRMAKDKKKYIREQLKKTNHEIKKNKNDFDKMRSHHKFLFLQQLKRDL